MIMMIMMISKTAKDPPTPAPTTTPTVDSKKYVPVMDEDLGKKSMTMSNNREQFCFSSGNRIICSKFGGGMYVTYGMAKYFSS